MADPVYIEGQLPTHPNFLLPQTSVESRTAVYAQQTMKGSFTCIILLGSFACALKQGTSLPELAVVDGEFKAGGLDPLDMSGMLNKRACSTCYPYSCDGHCCQFNK